MCVLQRMLGPSEAVEQELITLEPLKHKHSLFHLKPS